MPLLVPAEVGSILRLFSGEMKLAAERQRPEMGWGAGLQHHPLTRGSQTPLLLLSTGTSPDLQDLHGVTSAPTGHSTQLNRCGGRVLSSKDAPSAYSILKISAISPQSKPKRARPRGIRSCLQSSLQMVFTGAPHGCVLGCRSDQCYADQAEGCKGFPAPSSRKRPCREMLRDQDALATGMEVMAVKVVEGVISQQGMEWIGLTKLPKAYEQPTRADADLTALS